MGQRNRASRTGQSEQGCQHRTARRLLLGRGRTVRAGQPGKDSWKRTAVTGQPGHDSQDRKDSIGQPEDYSQK
jgi:hypothetical protein